MVYRRLHQDFWEELSLNCIYIDRAEKVGCGNPKNCEFCGFDYEEHKRRIKRGLVKGEDGLWHMVATKKVTE